jgi:hypothetical protein
MKMLLSYALLVFCMGNISAQNKSDVVLGNGMQHAKDVNSSNEIGYVPTDSSKTFIYPNPAADRVWLVMSNDTAEVYRVSIFDMNERLISHRDYRTVPGMHKYLVTLPPPASQHETIFLKVTDGEGRQEEIFRVLRQ